MSRRIIRVKGLDGGLLLRQLVTFTAVLVFTLVLLSLLHLMTSGVILRREEQRQTAFMLQVMPQATVFSQMRFEDERVDAIQSAYRDSTLLGYCVTVTTQGFAGPVTTMTGVNVNGEVTGVVVIDQQESVTLGDGIEDEQFLAGFVGGSGTLYVGAGRNGVDGVSGATASSQAVVDGVNIALNCVANLDLEGGDDFEGEV